MRRGKWSCVWAMVSRFWWRHESRKWQARARDWECKYKAMEKENQRLRKERNLLIDNLGQLVGGSHER